MNKIVVIHQPDFLPYLGFFHRFLMADLWVILDNVQFVSGTSRSWHNRDKIKTPQGEKWITVAVQKSQKDSKINEMTLSKTENWRKNNVNLLIQNYKKAPYFDEIFPFIEKLYSYECERMMDFNLKSIDMLNDFFDIKIDTIIASTLNTEGKNNELVIDIVKKVNSDTYLSGIGAKDYMIPELYEKAGITILWQDFKHPIYPQLHGSFIPYLSSIDLLFNCGIEKSREILRTTL